MKNTIFPTRAFLTAFACLLATWLPAHGVHAADIDLALAQSTIKISTFYNGTTLKLSGSVPADAEAVIQVDGAKHTVPLKVKGKVAGVLWMNKTDVELENTPSVYMLYTPKNFTISPSFDAGYDALEKDITIIPETADKHFVFGEFIKLMEKSAVYGINNGAVTYGSINNGHKPFTATITIPPKMNAGDYTITAFAVKNSTMLASTAQKLTIEFAGLPKAIASLAFGMPLLFGIMAVFIAVATGLIIGVLFKGGGGAH